MYIVRYLYVMYTHTHTPVGIAGSLYPMPLPTWQGVLEVSPVVGFRGHVLLAPRGWWGRG